MLISYSATLPAAVGPGPQREISSGKTETENYQKFIGEDQKSKKRCPLEIRVDCCGLKLDEDKKSLRQDLA